MPFESINPPQFPTPIAPYSAGARAGNTVYVSGVLALGEGGAVLHVGLRVAQRMDRGTIVLLLADGGWKYLSTGLWSRSEDEATEGVRGKVMW